jgi:hypothetical protein
MFEDDNLAIAGNSMTPQSIELMSRPMRKLATAQIEKGMVQGLAATSTEQVRALLTNLADHP